MTRNQAGICWLQELSRWCLAAVFLASGAVSCSDGDETSKKRKKPLPMVKTALVEVKALSDRLELTGSIEPTRVARMAAPVEGPVIACPVREGDHVNRGVLLARIGRTKGDDAVAASARTELKREELELSRIEKLVQRGALPGEELDEARVKVSESRARLARAMERLGDYRIRAPWEGVVSRVHVAVGDFVAARDALVELFDPESLVLQFAVPEASAARVMQGAPVVVALDAHPGKPFAAGVTRIYPEIDRRTHTRTVEATIEGNVALFPGMFARLQLTLSLETNALSVPIEAILLRNDKPLVFVITEAGKARQRAVKTGIEDAGRVQILDGIQEGERVAIAGHTRLRDGAEVRRFSHRGKRNKQARPKGTRAAGKGR